MKSVKTLMIATVLVPLAVSAQNAAPAEHERRDTPASTESDSSRSTGNMLDDSAITAKVKTAFVANADVSAMDIKVTTTNGVVHLSGIATSQREAEKAVSLARNVSGVQSVVNDIRTANGSGQ